MRFAGAGAGAGFKSLLTGDTIELPKTWREHDDLHCIPRYNSYWDRSYEHESDEDCGTNDPSSPIPRYGRGARIKHWGRRTLRSRAVTGDKDDCVECGRDDLLLLMVWWLCIRDHDLLVFQVQ